jgi:hypothetical protein
MVRNGLLQQDPRIHAGRRKRGSRDSKIGEGRDALRGPYQAAVEAE